MEFTVATRMTNLFFSVRTENGLNIESVRKVRHAIPTRETVTIHTTTAAATKKETKKVTTAVTTVETTAGTTILQNARAANSNASEMNHITATATARGSMMHAVKTVATLQLEDATAVPETTAVTTAAGTPVETAAAAPQEIVQLYISAILNAVIAAVLTHV